MSRIRYPYLPGESERGEKVAKCLVECVLMQVK